MTKDYQEFMNDIASDGAIGALKKMGISISEDIIKDLSEDTSIAKMNATRAKIRINTKSREVTDSHYVEVAYNEHLKNGGKPAEFKEGLKQFVRKEQERMPIKRREIVNG